MAEIAYDYSKDTENQKWTYSDYKNWELKPGERFELINGGAYAMAAPGTEHQRILTTLLGEFYIFFKGKKCSPFAAPFDVRLFYKDDDSDNTVVQPDLVVVCDAEKLAKEGCRGAPDLVIEILSPSNTAMEMQRKLLLYRSAGVPEYWIVNPDQKTVEMFYLKDLSYSTNFFTAETTIQSTVFSELQIPVELLFAEI
jgi:Uma2 family endonuclease